MTTLKHIVTIDEKDHLLIISKAGRHYEAKCHSERWTFGSAWYTLEGFIKRAEEEFRNMMSK